MLNGIIAVIIAYLLGSIPSAYIVTRLIARKDIRKLGGGNSGAHNVYLHVGKDAGIAVGVFDIAKGALAVVIAIFGLGAPVYFVLGAGLAAIAGHIWSVFLKFTGGNGMATTIGVLTVLMTQELLIAIAIMLLLWAVTRNPILSMNISLLISVPVAAALLGKPLLLIIYPLLVALILVIHFLPTARAALAKSGSKENLGAELMRRKEAKK